MEEDENQLMQNKNICCNICGESEFSVLEGFYYCVECGTKQEQVRAIEMDDQDMFNESQHVTKHKIKIDKKEETGEITSWEFYNYVLRGMVEDLLNLGAKEELKLTAFQVWAAFLRRNEVAFFSKKEPQLPKMNVRYFSRDARTIYNHKITKTKRKRQYRNRHVAKGDEERNAKRAWKQSKRKLDVSSYSIKSNDTNDSVAASVNSGSTSRTSGGALQLKYSVAARKTLKNLMPLKHLKKHETDDQGSLKCHKLRLNSRQTPRFVNTTTTMSMKQVYAILAIALNLIGDDIQLSDLVRYMNEEHITTRNVLNYLPENIRSSGATLLKEISFSDFPDKYGTYTLREQICYLARAIPIIGFEMPDLFELSRRYVADLNLPTEFADYIERLMNVLPPKMKTRTPHQYPHYEARAMAYILFTAKLLFGLDGEKERSISKSAKEINKELNHINATNQTETKQPELFVWTDWVKYVEMRKVILARYSAAYCRQYNEILTTDQVIHDLAEKERRQKESEYNHRQTHIERLNRVQENVRHIFEGLLTDKLDKDAENDAPYIQFEPSLMPSHNYLRHVLLEAESGSETLIPIPEMMHEDHTKRTLMPFLDATEFCAFMAEHGWQVKVEDLACTANRTNMGIFHYDRNVTQNPHTNVFKANTNISKKAWLEEIKKKPLTSELIFKTELEDYNPIYKRKVERNMEKQQAHINEAFNALSSLIEKVRIKNPDETTEDESIIHSLRSKPTYEVFDNDNMEPLDIDLYGPQNYLERTFEERRYEDNSDDDDDKNDDDDDKNDDDDDKNDDDDDKNDDDDDDDDGDKDDVDDDKDNDDEEDNNTNVGSGASKNENKEITLFRSNFDYWSLIGYIGRISTECKKDLFSLFPPSFSWFMELCAQTIDVDWIAVFEQLLVLEMMFIHGIENIDDIDKCLYYTYYNNVKDINVLTNYYRDLW